MARKPRSYGDLITDFYNKRDKLFGAVEETPKKEDFFKNVVRGASAAVGGVPAVFGEFGKELADLASQPFRQLARTATGKKVEYAPIYTKRGREVFTRRYPALTGIAQGFKLTAEHLNPEGGFRKLREDYYRDPVGSFLNDAANIATVLSLGAGAAGKLATAAQSGRAAATAERLATTARALEKAAAAPFYPYKVPGKVLRRAGTKALASAIEKAAKGEAPGKLATTALRFSPEYQTLTREILTGQAKEEMARQTATRRVKEQLKITKDPDLHAASALIQEALDHPLAVMRKTLPEDMFNTQVAEWGVSPRAAEIAAKYREGTLDAETRKIIDQLNEVVVRGEVGTRARTARYVLERPVERAYQVGYEPSPAALKEAQRQAEAFRAQGAAIRAKAQEKLQKQQAKAAAALERYNQNFAAKAAALQGHIKNLAELAQDPNIRSVPKSVLNSLAKNVQEAYDRLSKAATEPVPPAVFDPRFNRQVRAALASTYNQAREAAWRVLDNQLKDTLARLSAAGADLRIALRDPEKLLSPEEKLSLLYGTKGDKEIANLLQKRRLAEKKLAIRDLKTEVTNLQSAVRGLPQSKVKPIINRAIREAAEAGTTEAFSAVMARFARELTATVEKSQRRLAETGKAGQKLGAQLERLSALAKEEAKAARIQAQLERQAQRVMDQSAFDIKNAPSRLKPILAANRALYIKLQEFRLRQEDLYIRHLLDKAIRDIPVTLEQLKEKGIDAEFRFHRPIDEKLARKTLGPKSTHLPKTFRARSEQLRTQKSLEYERSPFAQAAGEIESDIAHIRRQTVQAIAKHKNLVKTMKELGVNSVDEALKKGWVPWDPSAIFDTRNNIKEFSTYLADMKKRPTIFIPKPLFDTFRNYFEAPKGQTLGLITDIPNRAYYIARLAAVPGYVISQIFGNLMIGLIGSTNPAQYLKSVARVLRARLATGSLPAAPERIITAGPATAELARLQAESEARAGKIGKVQRKLDEIIAKPFAMARFLDNTARAAFYMSELKSLGNKEAAIERTLRAMGEFDRMSPVERDYIRRVIPLWAWHREITRIAFHLPVDNPWRITWFLHLGQQANDRNGGLTWDSLVKIANRYLDFGQAVPHSQVGEVFKGPLLGAGKILGPVPKILFQSSTGERAGTGQPFRRPGEFGAKPTAPSIGRQILDLLPQFRLAEGIAGRRRVVRFVTGEPMTITVKPKTAYDKMIEKYYGKTKKTIPTGEDPFASILGFLTGFPAYTEEVERRPRKKTA